MLVIDPTWYPALELIDQFQPEEVPFEAALGFKFRQPARLGDQRVFSTGQDVAERWADADVPAWIFAPIAGGSPSRVSRTNARGA